MKIFKILAVLAMSATLLVGCGKTQEKPKNTATEVVAETETETEAEMTSEEAIEIAQAHVAKKYGDRFAKHEISTIQEDLHWYVYYDPTNETADEELEIDILKKTGEIVFEMID
jgi:uncharacterized protein YcfL